MYRELDVHVALYLGAAAGVDEFLGRLGDDGVAVVIEPVDQRTDRRVFLIFNDRGVIERAQQRPAALGFLEEALVIDVEAERLGGCIQVGAIDKERNFVGRGGHSVSRVVVVGKAFWRDGSGSRIQRSILPRSGGSVCTDVTANKDRSGQ